MSALIATHDIRFDPPWMSIARAELGVTETPGPLHTARIIEYGSVTTLKPTTDEIPWCSDFWCWVHEQNGIKSPRSAAALDWLHWGIEIRELIVGATLVFDFGGHGHVGGCVGRGPNGFVPVLGGNQSNMVRISMMSMDRLKSIRMPAQPLITVAAPPIALAGTR